MPNLNYIPTVERLIGGSNSANKQAGTAKGSKPITINAAHDFREALENAYERAEELYQNALSDGVPKELARVHLPVGRYSRMRASANLRNWLAFLTLRASPDAQYEIRQYADAMIPILTEAFPKTMELWSGK